MRSHKLNKQTNKTIFTNTVSYKSHLAQLVVEFTVREYTQFFKIIFKWRRKVSRLWTINENVNHEIIRRNYKRNYLKELLEEIMEKIMRENDVMKLDEEF